MPATETYGLSLVNCLWGIALAHHRFPNSDQDPYWVAMLADPDWHWPKTKAEATKLFLGDLLGLKLNKWAKVIGNWSPWVKLFDFNQKPGNITHQERNGT